MFSTLLLLVCFFFLVAVSLIKQCLHYRQEIPQCEGLKPDKLDATEVLNLGERRDVALASVRSLEFSTPKSRASLRSKRLQGSREYFDIKTGPRLERKGSWMALSCTGYGVLHAQLTANSRTSTSSLQHLSKR